jgi:CCR4-NOT transcriptional regulation complex NOT5 subunit
LLTKSKTYTNVVCFFPIAHIFMLLDQLKLIFMYYHKKENEIAISL